LSGRVKWTSAAFGNRISVRGDEVYLRNFRRGLFRLNPQTRESLWHIDPVTPDEREKLLNVFHRFEPTLGESMKKGDWVNALEALGSRKPDDSSLYQELIF